MDNVSLREASKTPVSDFSPGYEFNFDEGVNEQPELHINYSYPRSPDWYYLAYMDRINFDEEKRNDLRSGNGFIINSPKATIKKDIKNPNGIFSTKFGQRLGDLNPFIDRYSCECGELKGKINNGIVCEKCGTMCKMVDDNYHLFGWIEIDPEYALINPSMFKELENFFGSSKYVKDKRLKRGSVLQNIIEYDKEISQDGFEIGPKIKNGEPYYGIGMIEFVNKFDEIMSFYHDKFKSSKPKMDIYDDIYSDIDKLFIHSIPVYTTHLRPMDIADGNMYFEKTNAFYSMMVRLAQSVNKNRRKIDRTPKLKNTQLYKLQMKFMELYDEIINIFSGKKGELRGLVAGRFNFSSRCVIRQNPDLRIDQVELPYVELVIVLQQRIINILHRLYNITLQQAYDRWAIAVTQVDDTIVKIIENIIKHEHNGEGLSVIINRNPTIAYGSIMQMYCVGINFNYTMSVPLQVLPPLYADFDGDVLNIFHIINNDFYERAREVFNPRNAMYISHSNGLLNKGVLVQRDTLINATTLNDLSLRKYTKEELDHIVVIKKKQKELMM